MKASIAPVSFAIDRSNVARFAAKYALWLGWIVLSVAAIFFAFNIFYFLNVIPPVPLSMKDIGIYHSVLHNASGDYDATLEPAQWYAFWRDTSNVFHLSAGQTGYCFSSVFAPTGLSTSIVHSWEKYDSANNKWNVVWRVSYPINGGIPNDQCR